MSEVAVRLAPDAWNDIDPGTEALLDNWKVAPGDLVEAGQVIGAAVLVKSTLDLTAPAAGRIARIGVPAEGTFGRGAPLAWIETGG